MQELEALTSLAGLPVARIPTPLCSVLAKLPGAWGRAARTWPTLLEMWHRRSSDDLAFLLLLAINDFVGSVPSTQVNMGDAASLVAMLTKCGSEVTACVQVCPFLTHLGNSYRTPNCTGATVVGNAV